MSELSLLIEHLDYVLLLFLRMSGLLIGSPVFGRKNVPNMSKIGFSAVLTLVVLTGAPEPAAYPAYGNLLAYILVCVKELFFGAAMGFVLTAMFNVTMTAGSIMDYQIGYSMASVYDAQSNMQTPVTGNLFNLMLLLIFFAMDGHLKLIGILCRTVEAVPVGTVSVPPGIVWAAAQVMTQSFVLAVMVAMPVLAAGLLLEVALGAVIKTVPQMNMFVVGIPLKLIIGLVVLSLSLAVFADFTKVIFDQTFRYVGVMFEALGSLA